MSATANTTTVRAKEFHFPLTVTWTGERRVTAHVEGKQAIEITPPVHVAGHLCLLAVDVVLVLYNYTTISFIPEGDDR